jgi:hypothetical protein
MPRGRPRKEKSPDMTPAVLPVETKSAAVTEVIENGMRKEEKETVEEVKVGEDKKDSPLQTEDEKVLESRKVLFMKLDPSQCFYESPEGYIVIGEKGRGRVWCRQANSGKGQWINPMR